MGDWFGGGGSAYYPVYKQDPVITPAVAKDAVISNSMQSQQRQGRTQKRGIGSTYHRTDPLQAGAADNDAPKKQKLGE